MRVRYCTLRDGVYLAVHRSQRILGRPPFQRFYVSHLKSWGQYGLARKQHSVDYLYLVVVILTAGHQREGVFTTYEPILRRIFSWRKRSTCNRPIISTTRLSAICLRLSARPTLQSFSIVASVCPAVSFYHSWLVS